MSNRQRNTLKIDGVNYLNAHSIARLGKLPLRVIGSLCTDPRHCRVTERNEMMIRADAVQLLMRHGQL